MHFVSFEDNEFIAGVAYCEGGMCAGGDWLISKFCFFLSLVWGLGFDGEASRL